MPPFQSPSSERKVGPESATLEMIRKKLNPDFSYVIFEKDGLNEKNPWIGLFAALGRLRLPILEVMTFEDPGREKMLLVAMFEAGRADKIMEEIISARLPREMVSYVYASSRQDEGFSDRIGQRKE